jgi:hypothetical protein
MLLTAWLAERLEWIPRSMGREGGEFEDRRGSRVRVVVEEGEPAESCVHGIALWVVQAEASGGNDVGFTLASRDEGVQVEATWSTEGACPLPSVLEVDDAGETAAVTMALESVGADCGLVRAAKALEIPAPGQRRG